MTIILYKPLIDLIKMASAPDAENYNLIGSSVKPSSSIRKDGSHDSLSTSNADHFKNNNVMGNRTFTLIITYIFVVIWLLCIS